MHPRLVPALVASVPVALLCATTACAGAPAAAPAEDLSAPAGDTHGAVAGAEEVAEPQLGLTAVEPSGAVRHLDLLDETVTELGAVGRPSAVSTDGRYVFARTTAGVEVVDSGRWTWDHVDHVHHYRAEPRLLGTVTGGGEAAVATSNLSTSGGTGVFFAGSGEAVLLDTEALSRGEVRERFRLGTEPHAGLVVPVGSYALVTQARDGVASSVVGRAADGSPTGRDEPCVVAAGTITPRVGAVVGCRDGALLARVEDDRLVVERIPYPDRTTAPPATSFANREGRPTVAGLAGTEGTDGVWLLDTRERSWRLLPSPEPLVAVSAVDDRDEHVLALTARGRLLVLDGSGGGGAVLARTDVLAARSVAAGRTPVLVADAQRAYLAAPVEGRVHEIDFADDARVARTFDQLGEQALVAGTGR